MLFVSVYVIRTSIFSCCCCCLISAHNVWCKVQQQCFFPAASCTECLIRKAKFNKMVAASAATTASASSVIHLCCQWPNHPWFFFRFTSSQQPLSILSFYLTGIYNCPQLGVSLSVSLQIIAVLFTLIFATINTEFICRPSTPPSAALFCCGQQSALLRPLKKRE